MDEVKVFVSQSGSAPISCPRCGERKIVVVEKFKAAKHTIKVKCPCGHQFTVHLDFRKHYRKAAEIDGFYNKKGLDLSGYYVNLSRGEDWDAGAVDRRSVNCIVKNISLGGVGLAPLGRHVIEEGDELRIHFVLNDKKGTVIDRKVIAVSVTKTLVGCQFTEPGDHDKALGFYLLP